MHQTISTGTAALIVESNHEARVYVNGIDRGTAPVEIELPADEIELKLTTDKPVPYLYSTKIRLTDNVKTIVRHKFGESEGLGSTQIITFEKTNDDNASIAAITDPTGAEVFAGDDYAGHTPLKFVLTPGTYEIMFRKQDYLEEKVTINAIAGYKLVVYVNLSQEKSEPAPVALKIKILDTPTGFLRVRSTPSAASSEIGQVIPGELYEIVEQDAVGEWYKIKLPDSKEGWVSAQYAQRVNEGE